MEDKESACQAMGITLMAAIFYVGGVAFKDGKCVRFIGLTEDERGFWQAVYSEGDSPIVKICHPSRIQFTVDEVR